MPNRKIKGITVAIGGDTTGLNKALQSVNKEIKDTQSQLKDVEKLLKLDPGNTELLTQKHKLLGESVEDFLSGGGGCGEVKTAAKPNNFVQCGVHQRHGCAQSLVELPFSGRRRRRRHHRERLRRRRGSAFWRNQQRKGIGSDVVLPFAGKGQAQEKTSFQVVER